MQIDLLPNLPTSGGYQTIMTAIDVFSSYRFKYSEGLDRYYDQTRLFANYTYHG